MCVGLAKIKVGLFSKKENMPTTDEIIYQIKKVICIFFYFNKNQVRTKPKFIFRVCEINLYK